MSRRTMKTSLSVIAAAVLRAACSMAPKYERPAAPVAGAFPYPGASSGTAAADLDWQNFFADARLKELIASALRNNRDLRIAVLNIEAARAQYDIRRADRVPNVGLSVAGSRTPGAGGSTTSVYTAGLAITSWEIDLFGRIASLSDAALAQYFASEEGRKAAQTSLIASVATTWLSLVADEELLELTRQTLVTRQDSLRLTKLRFDNGAASELDFRQAQSLYEGARVADAQTRRQRAIDLDTLALLVGEPVAPDFRAGVTSESVALPDLPAASNGAEGDPVPVAG